MTGDDQDAAEPAAGGWRSRRRRVWLAVVLVAAVAGAVAVAHRYRQGTTLAAGGEVIEVCWQPPAQTEWTAMSRDGIEFGLDYLQLVPRTGRVTVTAAELDDPTGGLRLVTVVLAPSANFSLGALGERWHVESYSAPYLRTLPAVVEPITTPGAAPTTFEGSRWQLGVLVTAPTTSTAASASGLTLHYESAGHRHTYRTKDPIRLLHDPAQHCGSA